jgi:iron complex outermembrane receptor protein
VLVAGGGGNAEYGGAARYGGAFGESGFYRVYGKSGHRDASQLANGTAVRDASTRTQGGFRVDWNDPVHDATVQGDAYEGDIDQSPSSRTIRGANVIATYVRRFDDGALARVQAYYDYTYRDSSRDLPRVVVDGRSRSAVRDEARGHSLGGRRSRIPRGARSRDQRPDPGVPAAGSHVCRGPICTRRTRFRFAPTFDLIVGAKVETNVYTGTEFLPNIRAAWRPADNHLLWAAASRAVRSPARIDREILRAGRATVLRRRQRHVRVGNRRRLRDRVSRSARHVRVADGHRLHYRLRSLAKPAAARRRRRIRQRHRGAATRVSRHGARGACFPTGSLFAGVTALREHWNVKPGNVDIGGVASLGNDPSVQWNARSAWDVTPDVTLDIMARRIAALPSPSVPAYTAVDARLAWRPTRSLEISVAGQNLTDPLHTEWGVATNRAEIQRRYFLAFLWTP